jgi:hypothetical protein
VLKALEERALVKAPLGWRRFRPLWLMTPVRPVAIRYVASGVALAGVVAIALVIHSISVVHRSGHGPASSKMSPTAAISETTVRGARIVPHEAREANVEVKGRLNAGERANAQSGKVDGDADSAELQRELAVSYPAPPMPLTEQERLLLRIAHRSDPVELAMVEPMLRPMQDADERREFQRFFGQSKKEAAIEQFVHPATEQVVAPEPPIPEQGAVAQVISEQAAPEQKTE